MTTYMHIRNNRYNRVTLSVKLSAPRIMCALNFHGLKYLGTSIARVHLWDYTPGTFSPYLSPFPVDLSMGRSQLACWIPSHLHRYG